MADSRKIPEIGHSISDHVARITIDRPEKRNAISAAMWARLAAIIQEIEAGDDIRLIIFEGRGEDFSAGADISEFETLRATPEGARDYDVVTENAYDAIRNTIIPTLAAINGSCFGGGVGLAMSCDIRIAAEDAIMAIPAGRLGLAYPKKSLTHLTSVVGPAVAKDLLFTGRRFTAQDALRTGMISQIANGSLAEEVSKTAALIAANAPLTLRASKAVINAIIDTDGVVDSIDSDELKETISACYSSSDYAEGRTAFLEKRRPAFTGK